MAFYIRTSGQVFRIEPKFSKIERYCDGYQCPPDEDAYDVSVTLDEIEAERPGAIAAAAAEGRPTQFSQAQLEILTIHRKISDIMPDHGVFLFHGSAVAVDGEAYIFTAKSGTGKSTHAALWRRKFGDRAVMVNDDKPFIKIADGKAYVCGSPWNGKHRLGENITVPVRAVCLLCRDTENKISKISKRDAFPMLYEQSYRPDDPVRLGKTLALIDAFASSAGIYRLYCNMSPEAADIAYDAMKEQI